MSIYDQFFSVFNNIKMIKFFSLFLAINKNNLMKREREREKRNI